MKRFIFNSIIFFLVLFSFSLNPVNAETNEIIFVTLDAKTTLPLFKAVISNAFQNFPQETADFEKKFSEYAKTKGLYLKLNLKTLHEKLIVFEEEYFSFSGSIRCSIFSDFSKALSVDIESLPSEFFKKCKSDNFAEFIEYDKEKDSVLITYAKAAPKIEVTSTVLKWGKEITLPPEVSDSAKFLLFNARIAWSKIADVCEVRFPYLFSKKELAENQAVYNELRKVKNLEFSMSPTFFSILAEFHNNETKSDFESLIKIDVAAFEKDILKKAQTGQGGNSDIKCLNGILSFVKEGEKVGISFNFDTPEKAEFWQKNIFAKFFR